MASSNDGVRLVAVNGFLGYGYHPDSLANGLAMAPHLLGADAGSTDPGPYYLGSGKQLTTPVQVKRDLCHALVGACRTSVPLVIGSAGTSGGEPHLQSLLNVVYEIAREEHLSFRLAAIHAEVDRATVKAALREGRLRPLRGAPEVTEAGLDNTVRIVGQMGIEPFAEALSAGANVVIAGRACDPAIYAALPALQGYDLGLALHLGKIMECGAQCAIPLAANDCLLGILRRDHFLVRPLNPSRRCTAASVAAHSLYEQPDPFVFHEPDGTVDLSQASFEQVDESTVRVSGSQFRPSVDGIRIKLEGARLCGYRAVTIAGVRDAAAIGALDAIEASARAAVERNLSGIVAPESYQLYYRYYGRDAVLGARDPERCGPIHEVGVVIEAIASTQELADTIVALARSSTLHCPFSGRKTTAGNLAFPFSPSDMSAGPVYEFSVYHTIQVDHPGSLFPIEYVSVDGGKRQ